MGGIIPIECNLFPSNNFLDFKLTGLQGDVMKESMNVSKTLSWKLTSSANKTKFISGVKKSKLVKDNIVVQTMRYMELLKELKKSGNKNKKTL